VIQKEIATLQKEGVGKEALERVKSQKEGHFDLMKNNLGALNTILALGHHLCGDPLFIEKETKERLPKVTSKEIEVVANEFLSSKEVIKLYYTSTQNKRRAKKPS